MRKYLSRCLPLSLTVALTIAFAGCKTTGTVKVEAKKIFFPNLPNRPRIQYLTTLRGEESFKNKDENAFATFLLGEEKKSKVSGIKKAYGIAAHDGRVYVCDTLAGTVKVFDLKKQKFFEIGQKRGEGQLLKPVSVAVDSLGYLFVVDILRKRIVVFDKDLNFFTSFVGPEPCRIVDIAIYGDEVFALDNDKTSAIHVLRRTDGKHLRSFGKRGVKPMEFNFPISISVGPEGNLFVTDMLNFRIQKLDRNGKSIWVYGQLGRRLGQFSRPRGIEVGPDGIIYVVESAFEVVQMFNQKHQILMPLGGPGVTDGAMLLPGQVTTDATSLPYFKKYLHPNFNAEYLIFVTNQLGPSPVNVYAFGSFPEGFAFEKVIRNLPKQAAPKNPLNVEGEDGSSKGDDKPGNDKSPTE